MVGKIGECYNNRMKSKKIISILEIGSYNGVDAYDLSQQFQVEPRNVHIIEPVPSSADTIIERYPNYNVHRLAFSNYTKEEEIFHVNAYRSSLREKEIYNYNDDIKVYVIRADDFIRMYNIEHYDLVKIDVEGCTYEVLEGFGELIKNVKIFHLETETIESWKGQKQRDDVLNFPPLKNNFDLVFEHDYDIQQDLILINKKI